MGPLMGEGWEGVNPPLSGASNDTKTNAADYIMAHSEHPGGITPTLTRPHQGGGNAPAMCEHRSPHAAEGMVGAHELGDRGQGALSARRVAPAHGIPELKRAVRDQYALWRPSVVLIEDTASGTN